MDLDQDELRELWERLSSPVFPVLQWEDGCIINMENAHVRQAGSRWVYVDDVDGYRLIDASDAQTLIDDNLVAIWTDHAAEIVDGTLGTERTHATD